MNVGSHGFNISEARKKFEVRYNYLKKFTDSIDMDFLKVDSNLHAFHLWGHQKTHTLTLASGVLIMQNHFKEYFVSSMGLSYIDSINFFEHSKDKDIAILDNILLPALSTSNLKFIPDGHKYNRVEKTLKLLNNSYVHKYLNVCVGKNDDYSNCSICSKCKRTMMTIKTAGKANEFRNIFNFDIYNNVKKSYLISQVANQKNNPYAKYNIDYADSQKYPLPSKLLSKIINWFIKAIIYYKRQLKRVLR